MEVTKAVWLAERERVERSPPSPSESQLRYGEEDNVCVRDDAHGPWCVLE